MGRASSLGLFPVTLGHFTGPLPRFGLRIKKPEIRASHLQGKDEMKQGMDLTTTAQLSNV